jgi:hypothetical protein
VALKAAGYHRNQFELAIAISTAPRVWRALRSMTIDWAEFRNIRREGSMHQSRMTAFLCRLALLPLMGLILTSILAPARADTIVFYAPALGASLDLSAYEFGKNNSELILTFSGETQSNMNFLVELAIYNPPSVDGLIEIYTGNTTSKADLYAEVHLSGVVLGPALTLPYTGQVEYIATYSTLTVDVYHSGGFDLVTNGPAYDLVTNGLAVPEASTWSMLLVGFAGLGLAAYGRGRRMAPLA